MLQRNTASIRALMSERIERLLLELYRFGFHSKSGQTNHVKIGIHSFPASRLGLKGRCGEHAGKFTGCAVGKGTQRNSPNLVW